MKRPVPKLHTDKEAEAFLESDLSDLDFAQFKPTRFKFAHDAAPSKRRSRGGGRAQSGSDILVPATDPILLKPHK